MMPYCTSCGSEIPEGQGSSCSMCYGDISYGRDGYYRDWAEERSSQQAQEENKRYKEALVRIANGHCATDSDSVALMALYPDDYDSLIPDEYLNGGK